MNSIAKTPTTGRDPFACGDLGDSAELARLAAINADPTPATVEALLLGAALEQRYVNPAEITAPVLIAA